MNTSPKGWKSPNVWARSEKYEDNLVRQLLIPESVFECAVGIDDNLFVENEYGRWPAGVSGSSAVPGFHAMLPLGTNSGDPLTRGSWHGELKPVPPSEVLASYDTALSFHAENDTRTGLRRPQLGAVHAVLGYWTTQRRTPATVVMPTGTGKTDTMLALLVAAQAERLLVLVPSDALRDQIADKFVTLGVLQEKRIVSNTAVRPKVGQVQHRFTSVETAKAFAAACNVIVATPQVLNQSTPEAREALLAACSHLFVDEAHHVAARDWSAVRAAFEQKHVVQFTATPFREDGKHLQGRIIYAFPLREAQKDNYFSKIDYTSVIDFDNLDRAVAEQALERLRADLAKGLDHVMMVRVGTIPRTQEVLPIYTELAEDLNPVRMYSGMGVRAKTDAMNALKNGTSRVVICVNMLGEGYDLPALKIAAVHDPQKSLGVTLQFIGRFARTSTNDRYGTASMFVARRDMDVDPRLRALYAEDADWNLILRDLTESTVDAQQEVSDFESNFTSLPDEVTLQSLLPKMSTVVYRTATRHWEPTKIVDFFGEDNLLTVPIGINASDGVAWCVVEHRQSVRWGDIRTIEEVMYQLYVLYFDSERRLLFINHSANQGVFEDLAEAVAGADAKRFTGSTIYRVMADIDRLVPTTVGVVDTLNQFRRFSMHVGSDVTESFTEAEAGTKSQTNISGGGFRQGEYVSISASRKGRVWSHNTARSLKDWCDWCDGIGTLLLDETISIEQVIGQFILPETMKTRPEGVLLAAEWPWFVHTLRDERLRLTFGGKTYDLVDVDIVPDTDETTGPLRFAFVTDAWKVNYQADVIDEKLCYSCIDGQELEVQTARVKSPLSRWLNDAGLTFILDGDRMIDADLLYTVKADRDPYTRERIILQDWSKTNLKVESQTSARLPESIQFKAIEILKAEGDWDIILDDDGSGEIADVVAMRLRSNELIVRLVHCKYSHGVSAGKRLADLYEVCGQAQKSVIWRRQDMTPFFRTLANRAKKKQDRTGVSPFEVGDARTLFRLRDKAQIASRKMEFVVVQPGLSATSATKQQLELLASTELYLRTTVNGSLGVWGNK